jgi:hypothetical protein
VEMFRVTSHSAAFVPERFKQHILNVSLEHCCFAGWILSTAFSECVSGRMGDEWFIEKIWNETNVFQPALNVP